MKLLVWNIEKFTSARLADPPEWSTCGDAAAAVSDKSYDPLYKQNYRKQLSPDEQFSTHLFRQTKARPHNWYTDQQKEVIDNFLVRHPTKLLADAQTYTRAAVDVVWPTPRPPYALGMNKSRKAINAIKASRGVPGPIATFRIWKNFWHIIKTSDHAPIYIDVK